MLTSDFLDTVTLREKRVLLRHTGLFEGLSKQIGMWCDIRRAA